MFDIIIVGCGPSGMSAALYALRGGKNVLILEQDSIGGQIASSPKIENFPSINSISGLDFSSSLFEQISSLGVNFELDKIVAIKKEEEVFTVIGEYSTYQAKSVIIATGCQHRSLNIENEQRLIGKGISYCAVCDGAFYSGKDVVLVGDANSALQYALLLSNYCKTVHIFTLFDCFFGDKLLIEKVGNKKNIFITHNMQTISLLGDDELEGIEFENTLTKTRTIVKTCACFVAIGQIPNNKAFSSLVDLKDGYIVTNDDLETKTKGLFAVGDCRSKKIRQLVTASSDGAIAAINAIKYLS